MLFYDLRINTSTTLLKKTITVTKSRRNPEFQNHTKSLIFTSAQAKPSKYLNFRAKKSINRTYLPVQSLPVLAGKFEYLKNFCKK